MSGVLRKMNLEVDLGGDGLSELADWIKKLHEARTGGVAMEGVLNDMQREMKKLGVDISLANDKTNSMNKAIEGFVAAGAAAKMIEFAKGLGGEMVDLASKHETTAVSFKVLLKDAKLAQQVMEDLDKASIKTPFKPDEYIAAGKLMLNAKVPVKGLTNELQMMGDIASGAGVKITEMAEIYAKNKFGGLVQTEDIMQLANKGIPIFDELAKVFGTTSEQIRKLAETGQIKFEHLQKAFKNMTKEGGAYFGMMDEQSKTYAGIMSTYEGNMDKFKMKLGEMLVVALKPAIEGMISFVSWITQNEAAMQVAKKVFIVLIPVIGVALVAALWAAAAAAWAFISPFIPFILIGAAIIAIIMAIILVVQDIYTWFQGGDSVFGEWLDPLAENINKVKAFFVNGWKSIRDFFDRNGRFIVMALFPLSALYYYWDEIMNFFRSIPGRIVSFFEELPDRIISTMAGLGDRLKDALKDILPGWAVKLIGRVSADNIEARADGGPVSAGREYIVGEEGPERFVPNTSGFIVPNSGLGGSGSRAVNITIAPVINFNGSSARDDADTIINKVIQVIEEKIYQAGLMAGLEVG